MSKRRLIRWGLVVMVCTAAGTLAVMLFDWVGYVQSWGGAMFKATSGGALGWMVSRHVCELDLSKAGEGKDRAVAGLSQAFLIGAFAIAVASGV